MKICILPNATVAVPSPVPVVLCAGGEDSPLTGWELAPSRLMQLIEIFRGANAKTKSRQNVRHRLSFSKIWPGPREQFGTLAEAEGFILAHFAALPEAGTVVFQTENGLSHNLNDATMETCKFTHLGLAVRVDYQFTGGGLT